MLSPERESHRAECQESECPRERGSCHSRACVLPSWPSPLLSDEISVAGSLHPAKRQLRRAEQFEPRPNPAPGPVRFVRGVRSGQSRLELGIAMVVAGLDHLTRRRIHASVGHGYSSSVRPSAANAASATAISCSTVPALAPTAPTMIPSNLTGTPPPSMTTRPEL